MKTACMVAGFMVLTASIPSHAWYPDRLYCPDYAGDSNSVTTRAGNFDPSRCTYNGISLYGKVKVVSSFADIEVRVVESFPDLRVQVVNSFPDRCGKWEFVESFPDFTIKYVESFSDIDIKFVETFPGT
ncbi:MAG: hypothetical protein LIO77_00375 [Rikenellaceae bacterium]|nr:hypothetical protein [Rikenellaceae bacterium]